MISIRNAQPHDYETLREMHMHQGFAYQLPDLARDDWMVRAVLEDDGIMEMAVLLRKTAETYFLSRDVGSKKERLGKLLAMQESVGEYAKQQGLTDVHCWLPPQVERFGDLLLHVGWKKPMWTSYFKEL